MEPESPRTSAAIRRVRARWVLLAFIITFIAARVLVLLIMERVIPDLFLYLRGAHVHHLNYGIFLLAAVGGYLLFLPPTASRWPAVLYGVGLALTFDEFGMWLHLGGRYWQRASWDAIVVVGAVLGWLAYGPTRAYYRAQHWLLAGSVFAATLLFLWLLIRSLDRAGQRVLLRFEQVEEDFSP